MENVTRKRLPDVEIGERLKKCRNKRGLTQTQLCELIYGLPDNNGKERSEKQIGYIENGKRPLSMEYANLLSQVLEVRYEYLMGWDDYETENDCILSNMHIESEKTNKGFYEYIYKRHTTQSILEAMQYYLTYADTTADKLKEEKEDDKVEAAYKLLLSDNPSVVRNIADPYLSQARCLLEKGYKKSWDNLFGEGAYERALQEDQHRRDSIKMGEELEELEFLYAPDKWRGDCISNANRRLDWLKEMPLWIYDEHYKPVLKFSEKEAENFINELYDVVNALIQYHITKKKGQP